ncbi:uncharacterized protein LOC108100288 [Drosophila ficusphila]|uniref:uncharacterized protein LOC108100288 n=1 Tax=Drosophila ficusphila TaxID=30025 RepID=UPI0007E7FCEC|nr:uncharacterized protein LOC108100288 [Drosophila ficusphila]
MQAPKAVNPTPVLTMKIDDLKKYVPESEIELLERKKDEETALKVERELFQTRLNHLLHRLNDLDDKLELEDICEDDYRATDHLRDILSLRHQLLVERLVRIGTQLARIKKELKCRETAIYADLKARRLV